MVVMTCAKGFAQSLQGTMTTGLRAPLSDLTCLAVDIGPGWTKKPEVVAGPEPGGRGKLKSKTGVCKEHDYHLRSGCNKGSKLQLGMCLPNEGLAILSQLK